MRATPRIVAVCASLAAFAPAQAAEREPASSGGETVVRRLSADQYQQIIADVFGPGIKIGGRFEPDLREDGLRALGAGHVSVTATGLEQYHAMAHTIAEQIVDDQHRDTLVPCKPASSAKPDDACAGQFIARAGRLLYRRPLTAEELREQVGVASAAGEKLKSFYAGLEMSLSGMLEAPQFLFRKEIAEPDPARPGRYRLNAFSKAEWLSFFLWNTAPDSVLLSAAESGELQTERGLNRQVDRLLTSPRLEAGVRAFFTDMLQLDGLETLSKDAVIYPKFSFKVARDAQEQTLRTIVDLVLTSRGDYRDIFTTRKTFLTPAMGAIYRVPVPAQDNSMDGGWKAHEFADGDPRGVGILMQIGFLALHSHPGRSSPTLRGKALREILLCQKVPDPPGNVNFTVVQDTHNPVYKTARERLTAHRVDAMCAGCHKLVDPIGLAMENFDSSGGFRAAENGVAIDTEGELDGVKFNDAVGLGKAVHDNPAAAACLVNRLYSYAAGRTAAKGEAALISYLQEAFAVRGYRVPDLMRRIATSAAAYQVLPPQIEASAQSQENRR